LSSIPAFLRTLKAHRKTLQRVVDGEEAQASSAAAQAFVDGSTTEQIDDLGLEEQPAEEAIEATNAVVDALSHYGVSHIDMPTTPNRIWSVIPKRSATSAS
jgi:hypothetical protein